MELGVGALPEVRAELEAILASDKSLLGEVYRRTRDGQTPDDIRKIRGASRPNFVWNYLRTIRALLDQDLPTTPTVARGAATIFRSFLSQHDMSAATRAQLEQGLRILEQRAADPAGRRAEDEERSRLQARRKRTRFRAFMSTHYLTMCVIHMMRSRVIRS